MRILITGNMGYVGPVVVRHLRSTFPKAVLEGYDSGLFAAQIVSREALPEAALDCQHFGDIRDIRAERLEGFDAIVHLSAISNDPMGNRFEPQTDAINFLASTRLARLARDAGVASFVFASSCSVYGAGGDHPRRENDPLGPLTAYARSKVETERALEAIDAPDMQITCLRFATARGMSPRLRLDLVLNDFVACALTSGEITVLSDGTPWRPLIDVKDMALAIEWAVIRSDGPRFLTVNTGANDQNYTVAELATAVAEAVPGTSISVNRAAPADKRSYRVNFDLFEALAPEHQPLTTLEGSIGELVQGIHAWAGLSSGFRESDAMRLYTLSRHIEAGCLDTDIRWAEPQRAIAHA